MKHTDVTRRLRPALIAGLLLAAVAGAGAQPALPPHPRLLVTDAELPAIKERVQRQPWARAFYDVQVKSADDWLGKQIQLPPRGSQWWHYYACKKDGARLKTLSPTQHQCPVCGTIYTGWPYDDVVLDREHQALSGAVRTLGLVYRLTRDRRYADKAREILLAYAARYTQYPLHNIRGEAKVGGGRVGPQTLDEAVWLIPITQGADLIWDTLSDADRKQAEDGLFRPAAQVILQHRMGIHNIQCWKNSAVGLVGLLLGDQALIEDAVSSAHGFKAQIEKGVSPDGQWYEGAWGYHFYTVSAMLPLVEAGERCGLGLYAYEKEGRSYRRLFEGPLELATPSLLLPPFNDSGTVNLKSEAPLYEAALARYKEPALAAVLRGSNRQNLQAFIVGVDRLPDPPAGATASRNFEGSGYAILREGKDENATWLCLKYGPHGGGHGHPDKLNFVLCSGGRMLAVDPGTAAYGVPIQQEWYRTTLAHNTLTVDEANQNPTTGSCLAFGAVPRLSAVLADAGHIADGVTYRRAAALFGESLVLVLDLVESDKEHTYDVAYHNAGKWVAPPAGDAVTPPAKPGYMHLRDVVRLKGAPPAVDAGGIRVGLAAAAQPAGELWAGTGVGANTTDRVPCLVTRVKGNRAAFAWAISLQGGTPELRLAPAGAGYALEATIAGKTYRLTADPAGKPRLSAEGGGAKLAAGE